MRRVYGGWGWGVEKKTKQPGSEYHIGPGGDSFLLDLAGFKNVYFKKSLKPPDF